MVHGSRGLIVRVNFQFRCLLSGAVGDDISLYVPQAWTEARLIPSSRNTLEIAGRPITCPAAEPLHVITTVAADQGAAVVHYLGVRRPPLEAGSPSRDQHLGTPGTAAGKQADVEAELLAELDVPMIPGASISPTTTEQWPAWQSLLPCLSAYSRGTTAMDRTLTTLLQVPDRTSVYNTNMISTIVHKARPQQQRSAPPKSTVLGKKKKPAGHALDAVYASLKPQAPRIVVEVGGDRGGTSVVGPGPGACGLNAVPAAVMIKGKHPSRVHIGALLHSWANMCPMRVAV